MFIAFIIITCLLWTYSVWNKTWLIDWLTMLIVWISYSVLNVVIFRLRRPVITYERHTRALRVPAGDIGRQVLRTCRSSLLQRSYQCSGKRWHHGWDDVVQSEREVTVSAQSQVSSTVPTVPRCTGQLWTAACPQHHHWPTTRFVVTYSIS